MIIADILNLVGEKKATTETGSSEGTEGTHKYVELECLTKLLHEEGENAFQRVEKEIADLRSKLAAAEAADAASQRKLQGLEGGSISKLVSFRVRLNVY